jgi:pseudouridine kinase
MQPNIREHASEHPVLAIGAAGVDMVGVLEQDVLPGGLNLARNRFSLGGVARNVAENLARLGQPACLLSVVGADALGLQLLEHTAACGVDVSACLTSPDSQTASYLAIYNPSGQLQMAVEDMRVLDLLTTTYLKGQEQRFRDASLVFVDANLTPKALSTVFRLAKNAKVPVCADATTTALGRRMLPHLDQLFLLAANSAEASVLADCSKQVMERESALQAARQLVGRGTSIAIVTMAHLGVCYATAEVNGHVPAVHANITDPTGAGDALLATVLFGLVNEIPLDDAVRLGAAAAALVLNHAGTVLPGLSLERLYDELSL